MRHWYKKNKLQQLRGFCAVIEEGSVLKACKKMNIAQSSVSLQISSLERDLKVKLFKRDKQRLIPYPEALRFYKIAKKSLDEIDFMFENAMQSMKYDYDNIIKIAGHTYMLSHILPPYYKKILGNQPDTRFEIWNSSYEEAIDMLNNGSVDIAIYPVGNDFKMKNIEINEFYKCQFGIGVSKDHALAEIKDEEITWEMLSKYDYITIGKSVTTQGLKSRIEANRISSKFALHNGTWEICMGIMKEGLSVSGADTGYGKWHDDIVVKKCPHLAPEYKFHVLTNNKTNISKASNEFLSILKARA
jgi:DNA-binding transcriptional LysR family regulator